MMITVSKVVGVQPLDARIHHLRCRRPAARTELCRTRRRAGDVSAAPPLGESARLSPFRADQGGPFGVGEQLAARSNRPSALATVSYSAANNRCRLIATACETPPVLGLSSTALQCDASRRLYPRNGLVALPWSIATGARPSGNQKTLLATPSISPTPDDAPATAATEVPAQAIRAELLVHAHRRDPKSRPSGRRHGDIRPIDAGSVLPMDELAR